MLAIRLARTGRNKYPTYRIVAAESSRATTSKFVAILGHYNPHTKELVIKKDETVKLLSNGAQPSNSVIKLLQKEKIELPKWAVLTTRNRPSKKAQPEAKATPAEAVETVDATETASEPIVEAATANEAEVTSEVTESEPEDTAAGEAAQAESGEAAAEAGDVAIAEVAKEITETTE